jgi:competence protein ComEA
MSAYHSRQLTVILCILAATFVYALTKLYRAQAAKDSIITFAPAAVYEIRGDVMHAGFYCFAQEQRASALLQAAGGLQDNKQLSALKSDFPVIKNGKKLMFKTGAAHDAFWESSEMGAAARLNFFLPVDINIASADELMLIPGVGAKTAEAVVEYRETHKRIKSLDELGSLSGMGDKKMQALLPYISIEQ